MEEPKKYWRNVCYRHAQDPVVEAYVTPKLRFCEKYVLLEDKKILDVGCGNGTFTYYLSQKSAHVVGLDYSNYMISQNPSANLVIGAVERLPFRDNSFDVVFEANLLHHIDDQQQALAEMKRVSKSHVILVEPNANNPIMFLFSLLVRAEKGGLRSCKSRYIKLLDLVKLRLVSYVATGMISQNNTPGVLVPLLKFFDRKFPLGEYIIFVTQKLSNPNDSPGPWHRLR